MVAVSMEQVESALTSQGSWLLKQLGVRGHYAGYDAHGSPCAFLLCDGTPEDTKQAIRRRLGVPIEFVEGIELRPL